MMGIIADSIAALGAPPGRVQINVRSTLEDTAVWLDHEQLVSALIDLERNAVEAMPHGGMLTITAAGDPDRVTIPIEDTGTGIAPEHMDELLTPFFTTKPVGDGTGLGLPSAWGIVKAHRGNFRIASNADPGKGPTGTRISLTLPRRLVLADPRWTVIIHEEEAED
jgi:signal transduction histidine kinase